MINYKPIGVCGNIDSQWQNYASGVVPNCNSSKIGGHCVLLVAASADGANSNNGNNWWKIKNSWGTGWGESGLMRLYRDVTDKTTGPCGFCQEAIYSI